MDENQILKDSINKITQERASEREQHLFNASLPISKQIIDKNLVLDNSIEGADLIEKGTRRSIYKKGEIYYLGYLCNNTYKLYYPTKDYKQIYEEFIKANSQ